MLEFLKLNAGTVIVGAVVLFIIVAAFVKVRKDKKNGGGCGCGCAGCPSQGMCHLNTEKKDKKI